MDAPTDVGLWIWLDEDGSVLGIATTAAQARECAIRNALDRADEEVSPMEALGWALAGVPARIDQGGLHIDRLLLLLEPSADYREVGLNAVEVEDALRATAAA